MARRRHKKKDEGLVELALSSDWKLSAFLAAAAWFAAAVFLPGIASRSPILMPLSVMLQFLAWLLVLVFGAIAVFRYITQKQTESPAGNPLQAARTRPASASFQLPVRSEPSAADKAWLEFGASAQQAPSRPTSWSLEVLEQIEWKRFEDLCCAFYREKGIPAKTTRLGADGGIDIRLFQDEAMTQPLSIVQCKALNRQVGVKPVRELRGVMAHEKMEKAFFMAPGGFTDDARAFAAENRITLLGGKLFLAMLKRLPAESSQRLLTFATAGDWTTPTCPKCGERMAARNGSRGRFWGCTTYPRCRGKLPMRAKVSAALT